ncbi:hypothetical protein V2H45_17050 [Tumidithrix elongata RA019]|uniref:Uncharacterized protein n=1 Tax=Tumidithrix elongata BACA0141 TaxID=2716417 RepID=A0AAW9PZX5_9CYAN|nr:hypothetical protein [Tumidithrix elongata RA019]
MSPEYNKDENIPSSQFGQSFVINIVAIALLTIVLPLVIPSSKMAPSHASSNLDVITSTKAIVQK